MHRWKLVISGTIVFVIGAVLGTWLVNQRNTVNSDGWKTQYPDGPTMEMYQFACPFEYEIFSASQVSVSVMNSRNVTMGYSIVIMAGNRSDLLNPVEQVTTGLPTPHVNAKLRNLEDEVIHVVLEPYEIANLKWSLTADEKTLILQQESTEPTSEMQFWYDPEKPLVVLAYAISDEELTGPLLPNLWMSSYVGSCGIDVVRPGEIRYQPWANLAGVIALLGSLLWIAGYRSELWLHYYRLTAIIITLVLIVLAMNFVTWQSEWWTLSNIFLALCWLAIVLLVGTFIYSQVSEKIWQNPALINRTDSFIERNK
jgi:hypothetical protein